MKLLLALLLALGTGETVAFAAVAAPARLVLTLTAATVRAEAQEHYPVDTPIALDVTILGSADVTTVEAVLKAPSGAQTHVPLIACGSDRFRGTLTMSEAGSYAILVRSQRRGASFRSASVALDAVARPATPQHVEWAASSGVLSANRAPFAAAAT